MEQNSPDQNDYRTLTAYLVVNDASAAIAFYCAAFGATELFRLCEPGGKVGHAELRLGDSVLMLADEYPDFGAVGPNTLGGSPVKLQITVDDVDACTRRAIEAGATVLRPAKNEFHGHRQALLACPFGYSWFLSAQVEKVPVAQMQERFEKMMQG